MDKASWLSVCLLLSACAGLGPAQYARQVALMPGAKPLRVGVVVLGAEPQLPPAFAEPAAAPAGELAPAAAAPGVVYAERALPASLPAGDVLASLQQLGPFTDVVLLPFDGRGIASRAAVVQRVQDRVFETARAQQLDALLVVEGVRDDGLRFSDRDEGLFTLDTVLWWLAWPFGLWIPDRGYRPDCELVASMFWLGDVASYPEPAVVTAQASQRWLAPWDRARAPLLGLLLPPAWLADDPDAVSAALGGTVRAMLPVDLVRELKQAPLRGLGDATLALSRSERGYELRVDSAREVAAATLLSLPRGALSDASALAPVTLPMASELVLVDDGPRHHSRGHTPCADVDRAAHPLLRAQVRLVTGESVSRTWQIADLPR